MGNCSSSRRLGHSRRRQVLEESAAANVHLRHIHDRFRLKQRPELRRVMDALALSDQRFDSGIQHALSEALVIAAVVRKDLLHPI